MKTFNLKIVCPLNIVFDADVKQITFKTTSEVRGLLADHIPFMGSLTSHLMKVIINDNDVEYYSIKDGFVKFLENKCVVVTDEAYNIKDVSPSSIEKEEKYWEEVRTTNSNEQKKSQEAELQLKRINQIKSKIK